MLHWSALSSKYLANPAGRGVSAPPPDLQSMVPQQCISLCDASRGRARAKLQHLQSVLPQLPLDLHSHALLQHRRCRACRTVTAAMTAMLAGQSQPQGLHPLGCAFVSFLLM